MMSALHWTFLLCSALQVPIPNPPPTTTHLCLQRITIHRPRTFQQPTSEPLGADWGKAEMRGILAMQGSTAAAIRRAQSNAEPAVASLRNDLAYIERTVLSLPEGEEKEALLQGVADLRSRAVEEAARTKLPPTAPRAGKVQRRQAGRPERPEGQHKVTALLPTRKYSSKRPLAQQSGSYGDEFKPQAKKGRTSAKVGIRSTAAWRQHVWHWYACAIQLGNTSTWELSQTEAAGALTCMMLPAAGAWRDHRGQRQGHHAAHRAPPTVQEALAAVAAGSGHLVGSSCRQCWRQ
jgi:hypothetical protein